MRTSGVTFVETLSCVAIVAIVAGIATPVFASVRERGVRTAAMSNLHQIHLATMLYRQEYAGADVGSAQEMGLPSILVPHALGALYDAGPWKGRSPCGVNPTQPSLLQSRHTLMYQPFRESASDTSPSWAGAVERYGDRAWLFDDVNCDFRSSSYDDKYAPHRVLVVALSGSAYTVARTMDLSNDPFLP